jgi:hypothetical protein
MLNKKVCLFTTLLFPMITGGFVVTLPNYSVSSAGPGALSRRSNRAALPLLDPSFLLSYLGLRGWDLG